MKYELWEDEDGVVMFPSNHPQKSTFVKEGDIMHKTFEASDWDDARKQMHAYMGWEEYEPMEEGSRE